MAVNANEIVVGASGKVYVAPVGTAQPTDSDTALAAAFVDLGYVNENGVVFRDAKTVTPINVWQSFYPARRVVTARDATATFALAQWNADTVPLAFGGGTVVQPDAVNKPGEYKYTPPSAGARDERLLVVEWVDGTKNYRLVIPTGEVTDAVETNLVRTDNAELPIMFSVNGSDAGAPWYLLTDDPAFA